MKKLILVLLVVPAIIFVAVQFMGKTSYQRVLQEGDERKSAFLKSMAAHRFISLKETEAVQALVASAIERRSNSEAVPLTQLQTGKLERRIISMFAAYSDGTYESFIRFRYPPELNTPGLLAAPYDRSLRRDMGDLARSAGDTVILARLGGTGGLQKASTSELLETSFQLYQKAGAKWKDPIFCAGCLDAVAETSVDVNLNLFRGSYRSVNTILNSTNSFGLKATPVNDFIRPTAKETLERRGSLVTAYVSALLKAKKHDEFVPVFVHFYWVDEHQDWIPLEFVVGYAESKLHFLFDL